jgi:hypothetical protein
MQVIRTHVSDEWKMTSDAEDDGHALRSVQLRLDEPGVDLQLMDA